MIMQFVFSFLRIKMTITFSGFVNIEGQRQNIWPLYVLVSSQIDSSEVYSIIGGLTGAEINSLFY